MKKKGGGAVKGGRFEREIAQRLSLWLTGGADRTQLIRSVMSGGWKGRTAGFRQVGDLAPNGETGEKFRKWFAVECKHQRTIDLWQLWDGGKLLRWWDKIVMEAFEAGVQPLLIVRANGRPITVFAKDDLLQRPGFSPKEYVYVPWLQMIAFPLDELCACEPKDWLELAA